MARSQLIIALLACCCERGSLLRLDVPASRTTALRSPSLRAVRLARPVRAAPSATHVRTLPPQMVLGSGVLGSLWPTTLSKFWGLHALLWCGASAAVATLNPLLPLGAMTVRNFVRPDALCYLVQLRPFLAAFAAANLALSFFLYRSRDDAGTKNALAGALYFAGCATMLHALLCSGGVIPGLPPKGLAATLLSRALRPARLWHCVLALGSLFFAAKASLKDRLFTQEPAAALRFGDATGAMPTLALINSKSGAKIGERVAVKLQELAARSQPGALKVVDLSLVPPGEAIGQFAAEHDAYRVLVCGGDGTVTWVLSAVEELGADYTPPVAVLPLGTGNDLARVLGWGKGVRFEAIEEAVRQLDTARISFVRRPSRSIGPVPHPQMTRSSPTFGRSTAGS